MNTNQNHIISKLQITWHWIWKKTFNKEGSNGWELVQWEVIQERLNESSLFQNTMSTTDIVATWKREVNN